MLKPAPREPVGTVETAQNTASEEAIVLGAESIWSHSAASTPCAGAGRGCSQDAKLCLEACSEIATNDSNSSCL